MHRVIGERGFDDTPVSAETARDLFRDMVRARVFDDRALKLQRRGWMAGYPPFRGQEASQVGCAHAMREGDWLFPTYRSNAMQIARDVPVSDILLFRRGFAEYNSGHDVSNFPEAVPIATQIPHAVGAGMAADYRGDDVATVAYFGDGATSEGDFHEGMNFAGVFDAPTLFFCENNGWAISLPESRQTASQTIAQKAHAYGFDGRRVDGNDPLAVVEAVDDALGDVRSGDPVLLESLTYRQGAHTTSDDPSRYESRAAFPEWRTRDPLERYEEFLLAEGVVEDGARDELEAAANEEVDEAVTQAESVPEPDLDEMFANVFETPTPRQEDQCATLHERADRYDLEGVER
jgi:pyruvate dehydrogenase E1 component alpha subunit